MVVSLIFLLMPRIKEVLVYISVSIDIWYSRERNFLRRLYVTSETMPLPYSRECFVLVGYWVQVSTND